MEINRPTGVVKMEKGSGSRTEPCGTPVSQQTVVYIVTISKGNISLSDKYKMEYFDISLSIAISSVFPWDNGEDER